MTHLTHQSPYKNLTMPSAEVATPALARTQYIIASSNTWGQQLDSHFYTHSTRHSHHTHTLTHGSMHTLFLYLNPTKTLHSHKTTDLSHSPAAYIKHSNESSKTDSYTTSQHAKLYHQFIPAFYLVETRQTTLHDPQQTYRTASQKTHAQQHSFSTSNTPTTHLTSQHSSHTYTTLASAAIS